MNGLGRAGVLMATGAFALALVGSAFSAVNPRLMVGTTAQAGNTRATIEARVGTSDDVIGRLQVFLPAGFKLSSPPGGVDAGTLTATVLSTQIGPGTEMPFKLSGKVTAIPVNDPAVAYENANCDPVAHAGAWMARAQGGGNTWSFVIFVDATTGAETAFGQFKLVACFKSTSGANMDPLGNKFVSLSLALDRVTAPTAAGSYRWRSLFTPFTANTGTLNQAGSVEAQSLVKIASSALTLTGKRSPGKTKVRVTLGGKLIVDGEALGGGIVAIRHGATAAKLSPLGSVKTSSSGAFSKVVNLKKSEYFQVGATVGGQELGAAGCTASFGSAVPCLSATNGRVAVVSRVVHFSR